MLGLVIKRPWIDLILAGAKTWEIRGAATRVRGTIALIRGGSGLVVGTSGLLECRGPLDSETFERNVERHHVREGARPWPLYPKTYAWVLAEARPLPAPLPYKHPSGAVIWVRLSEQNMGDAYRGLLTATGDGPAA